MTKSKPPTSLKLFQGGKKFVNTQFTSTGYCHAKFPGKKKVSKTLSERRDKTFDYSLSRITSLLGHIAAQRGERDQYKEKELTFILHLLIGFYLLGNV